MSDVIRVFVEKKPGFDVEAQHIKTDLVENLGMDSIKELKLIHRYDISGLTGEEFAAARGTIFSEPNVDNVYDEEYPLQQNYTVFAMCCAFGGRFAAVTFQSDGGSYFLGTGYRGYRDSICSTLRRGIRRQCRGHCGGNCVQSFHHRCQLSFRRICSRRHGLWETKVG